MDRTSTTWVCVVIALLVAGCGQATGGATSTPAATIAAYVQACESGNMEAAQALLTADLRTLVATVGAPDCGLPRGPSANVGEPTVTGNEARVVWAWEGGGVPWGFTLSRADGTWLITNAQPTQRRAARTPAAAEAGSTPGTAGNAPVLPTATPPPQTEEDPDLLQGVAYIRQHGAPGTIIVVGTAPRDKALTAATTAVERYFAALQQGDTAALTAVTDTDIPTGRDPATANQVAGLELTEARVSEARTITVRGEHGANPPRQDRALPNEPHIEPILVQAIVPVHVRYRAFSVDLNWDGDAVAVYHPGDGWRVRPWGFFAAAAPNQTETWDGVALRLAGVGLGAHGTLLVAQLEPAGAGTVFANVSDDTGRGSTVSLPGMQQVGNTGTWYALLPPLSPDAVNVSVRMKLNLGGSFNAQREMTRTMRVAP